MSPDDPRHGTTNGYTNLGCRCARCRAAHAAYVRAHRRENTAAAVARKGAIGVLIERHRKEYDRLLLLARRGELEEAS
jgi:hypothetical protein